MELIPVHAMVAGYAVVVAFILMICLPTRVLNKTVVRESNDPHSFTPSRITR